MTTIIRSNGSKWAGQAPDSIDDLLQRLNKNRLSFRLFRGRFHHREHFGRNFFGNFDDLSAAFNVDTDDPDLIRTLRRAIIANWRRHRAA